MLWDQWYRQRILGRCCTDIYIYIVFCVHWAHTATYRVNYGHYTDIRWVVKILSIRNASLIKLCRFFQLHLHEHIIVFTKLYAPLLFCQYLQKSIWATLYNIILYYSEPVCANFVDRIWYGGSGGVTGRPLLPIHIIAYVQVLH